MLAKRIERHIDRTNRNLAITVGIVLAIVAGFLLLTARANYNLLFGPFSISNSELIAIKDPTKQLKYRFTVDAEAISTVIYTQYSVYYDKKTGEETDRYVRGVYQLLKLDNEHFLVLESDYESDNPKVSGALVPIPPEIVENCVSKMIEPQRKRVLPLMLDSTRFGDWMIFPLFVFVPFVLFTFWKLYRLIQRKSNVTIHPVYKALAAHGDPQAVSQAIEEDIMTYQAGIETPRATVTKNWIICPSRYGLHVGKMDELIWAYKKVTEHYVWFIPVGVATEAVFKFSDGKQFGFKGIVKNVDNTLDKVANYLPYIYLSYDVDYSFLYDRDRQQMIDNVAQAKREYEDALKAEQPRDGEAEEREV